MPTTNNSTYNGLNMDTNESTSQVENPQNNEEVYLASFSSILRENLGAYVVVEFLIGTNNLVVKEGILFGSGNNFITLYNDVENYYTVCDLYSIKFVNFFDPRYLRRRSEAEIANLSSFDHQASTGRDQTLPLYYSSARPGETVPISSNPGSGRLTFNNNGYNAGR